MTKKKVLFVCTHNSARSQMAETFLNAAYGEQYEALSAGTSPTAINPRVIAAMKEVGHDLSRNRAKNTDEFLGQRIDLVVTLCDDAREVCPFFPAGVKRDHHGFRDPGSCSGSEEDIMACVRLIRDEILEWVRVRFKD